MMATPVKTYSTWEWARAYLALIATSPIFLLCWFLGTVVQRLPQPITRWLHRCHERYTRDNPMDFRIPPNTTIPAYMHRWWRIPRNPIFNVYYHDVLRSDDDRALHDHPWWSFSIVLDGGYFEHRILEGGIHQKTWCPPGTMTFRWTGRKAHRLELRYEETGVVEQGHIEGYERPCRTIFMTGPVIRRWGFHDGIRGWVDAYKWDDHCEEHGLTAMRMDGGSDAVQSDRNTFTRN